MNSHERSRHVITNLTHSQFYLSLLLNPHLRVSDIAFEASFQSLTHFNRNFKKMVGQSPTEYREHLPTT